MKIFAIGDLHLSGHSPKPMDIFGGHWDGHWDKIRENWHALVSENDAVLIPGDLSWAMKLSEAAVDIDEICEMPGKKIIMRGNHDYWWSSLSQVTGLLTNNTHALQNNSIDLGEYVIAGTRGWLYPGFGQYDAETDEKLYKREAGRLELSLQHAKKQSPEAQIVGMMHYPPTGQAGGQTLFTGLFEEYEVQNVVYGHLHSGSIPGALNGDVRGVHYTLVSCDALEFKLTQII